MPDGLSHDAWRSYVLKHEIEPTVRSFLAPRLTDGALLTWPRCETAACGRTDPHPPHPYARDSDLQYDVQARCPGLDAPESNVEMMCRALREAMPVEQLRAEVAQMEGGLEKFNAWMRSVPADERDRLIAAVLADDGFPAGDDQ